MSRSTAAVSRLHRWGDCLLRVVVVTVAVGSVLAGSQALRAQITGAQKNDRPITRAITQLMSRQHLTRHPLDNEISNRWLTNYLKMLDPRKVFFSQADVDGFMDYRDQLDDMALRGDTTFAYQVFNKFLERIDHRVKMVDELLPAAHDFTVDEELVTDADQMPYAKNETEMRDRWRKRVKYDLLDLASEKKLEGKEAQEKISKRYHQLNKRMKQTDHDELLEMYLTAMTTAYDPHTTYMSADTLLSLMHMGSP